jgi:lipopolysaccharide biosynthesis glycosyltransferase
MSASQAIHIGIAFDQNYLPLFYAMAESLFTHNQQNELVLHVIVTGVSDASRAAIGSYVAKNNASIHFYEVDESQLKKYVLTASRTSAVYYRLMFPLLVPAEVTRLLYLDTDTLVLNDLREQYNLDIGKFPVAAVYDIYVQKQELLGITEEGEYFNSGVMLINIPVWKEQRISEQCFEYLIRYPERILYVDQCALNAVLRGKWMAMDYRMNCLYTYIPSDMNSPQRRAFIVDIVILHYTMHGPWKYLCKNPYRSLFPFYLRQSGYSQRNYIVDFHWRMIPERIWLNMLDLYFRSGVVKSAWRAMKGWARMVSGRTNKL